MTFYAGSTGSQAVSASIFSGPEGDELRAETAKNHRFNVAFGLSDHADSPDAVDDPLYGNLVAMQTTRNADGTFGYKPVATEACSLDTLKSDFYPARTAV